MNDIEIFEFKHRKTKKDKIVHKKAYKKSQGKCKICGEEIYELLDVHRITPGSQGGEYRGKNIVTICTRCHRLEHSGYIIIHEWVKSTAGYLLKVTINNEEKFL